MCRNALALLVSFPILQVILELVFGMDPQRLTPEVLQRCSTAFNTFDEHLFSFPINLPGFGVPSSCPPTYTVSHLADCMELFSLLHAVLALDSDHGCLRSAVVSNSGPEGGSGFAEIRVFACNAGFRAGLQAREVLTDIIKDNMQHIWARQSRYMHWRQPAGIISCFHLLEGQLAPNLRCRPQ